MQTLASKAGEMTFVYVRKNDSIKLEKIKKLSDSLYEIGCFDFIVIDLLRDPFALEYLAKNGDPFRYFGFDSGVSVNDILSSPKKYSRFSNIIIIDQVP